MTATTASGTFCILSIDGGGVRGVIPAMLLRDLNRTAGLRLDHVDLLAGTSAGSLAAFGLAAGVSIDKITEVFQSPEACRRIFTPNDRATLTRGRGLRALLVRALERLAGNEHRGVLGMLDQLLNPRYTNTGIEGLLRELVAPIPLRDLPQRVFAPSLCLDDREDGQPMWRATAFHNLGARSTEDGFGGHADASVIDAVLASSAAPVDFPPYRYQNRLYVDGGMTCTNPSALALAAAIGAGCIGPDAVPLAEVRLLSLGTGANTTVFPPPADVFPPPFGVLGWMWPAARGPKTATPAFPLPSALMDASAEAADYQVRMQLAPAHYRRVQLALGDDHIALDDADALPDLIARTEAYLSTPQWDATRTWVRRSFSR